MWKTGLVRGKPPCPFQPMYSSILDSIDITYDVKALVPDPKGVEGLRRSWGGLPQHWPLPSYLSMSYPLYLHYLFIKSTGQMVSAYDLRALMGRIWNVGRKIERSLQNDYVRKMLKKISDWAYPRVFERGPKYMLFCHMHALTGKAPHTKGQIREDILAWVGEGGEVNGVYKKKNVNRPFVKKTLDRVFSTWYHGEPDGHLTMEEFSRDVVRWGTSGGSPKTKMFGSEYRTKWAWGMSRVMGDDMVYKPADVIGDGDRSDQRAKIALKEEAQKTREIISTPISSYLRQCYLLYRWGKPPIKSPIGDPDWLYKIQSSGYKWYGTVDGKSFDHWVPKWFVLDVVDRLGDLDPECRAVADKEMQSIEKLVVTWEGHDYLYLGGLLSGWRLTSLVGSLLSCCAAEFIIENSGQVGAYTYCVLGDDITILSNVASMSKDKLVALYENFGLVANLEKTVVGEVGEFLKMIYSRGGVWGYPCLALSSAVYANPWISSYQLEKEEEMSNIHMTILSRYLVHRTGGNSVKSFFRKWTVGCLTSSFGPGRWDDWVSTPMSAGGGGCYEMNDFKKWVRIDRKMRGNKVAPKMMFAYLVGLLKWKTIFTDIVKFKPINLRATYINAKTLAGLSGTPAPGFKHQVNITKTISDFLSGDINRKALNEALMYPIPRSIRGEEPGEIIKYLFSGYRETSGITSVSHTIEGQSHNSTLSRYVSGAVSVSKRFNQPRVFKPAVTLYYMDTYKNAMETYGTW